MKESLSGEQDHDPCIQDGVLRESTRGRGGLEFLKYLAIGKGWDLVGEGYNLFSVGWVWSMMFLKVVI